MRGKSVIAPSSKKLRHPWLFLVALAIQLVAIDGLSYYLAPALTKGLLAFSYGLVAIGVARNLSWWGIRFIGLGLFLNLIVMSANSGFMPVSPEAAGRAGLEHLTAQVEPGEYIPGTKGALLVSSASRLQWLSDSIAVRSINMVVSPGDIIMVFGFLFFVVEALGGKFWRSSPRLADVKRYET